MLPLLCLGSCRLLFKTSKAGSLLRNRSIPPTRRPEVQPRKAQRWDHGGPLLPCPHVTVVEESLFHPSTYSLAGSCRLMPWLWDEDVGGTQTFMPPNPYPVSLHLGFHLCALRHCPVSLFSSGFWSFHYFFPAYFCFCNAGG